MQGKKSHLRYYILLIISLLEQKTSAFDKGNCPLGTASHVHFDICKSCSIGRFRESGSDECLKCNSGFITPNIGATGKTHCDVTIDKNVSCSAGQYWYNDDYECEPCPLNSYRSGNESYSCQDCPEGTITVKTGTSSVDGCIFLGACSSGTIWNVDDQWCQPCNIGYFREENDHYCKPCPLGMTTVHVGARLYEDCVAIDKKVFNLAECPSGTQQNIHMTGCVVCPNDSYRNYLQSNECQSCPENTQTIFEGATDAMYCLQKKQIMHIMQILKNYELPICELGTEWISNKCIQCSENTYRDSLKVKSCQKCSSESNNSIRGLISPELCTSSNINLNNQESKDLHNGDCPGGMQWEKNDKECMLCDYGHYSSGGEMCRSCLLGMTTLRKGAKSIHDCLLPNLLDNNIPHFDAGHCPLGTEWNSMLSGCYLCKKGFYGGGRVYCEKCPDDTTTMGTGSMTKDSCYLKNDAFNIIPTNLEGCPEGYQNQSKFWCIPCPRGYYKNSHDWSSCRKCVHDFLTDNIGSTSWHDCVPEFIEDFSPEYGPVAGGTFVFINLPNSINSRVQSVFVAGVECDLIHASAMNGMVGCITRPSRSSVESGLVQITLIDGKIVFSEDKFSYMANPIIQSINRLSALNSGGAKIKVLGKNLNSVALPSLLFYKKDHRKMEDFTPIEKPCLVMSDEIMECFIDSWLEEGGIHKRSLDDAMAVEYDIGLNLDGIDDYKNLTALSEEFCCFNFFPNPIIEKFSTDPLYITHPHYPICIDGYNLTTGLSKEDAQIKVGNCFADVVNIYDNCIEMVLCANPERNELLPVTISIGTFYFEVGSIYITDVKVGPESSQLHDIVVPILYFFSIVTIILIIIYSIYVCIRAKKLQKKLMQVDAIDDHEVSFVSSTLPPLPVESVFGNKRLTDQGVAMRQLALPDDYKKDCKNQIKDKRSNTRKL